MAKKVKMTNDKIRQAIATSLNDPTCHAKWSDNLADTDPGHYGLRDLRAEVQSSDIEVDDSEERFTYKNCKLSFKARLGGTSDENGHDFSVKRTVSGSGRFTLSNSSVQVDDFSIDGRVNLLDRDK